MDKGYNGGKYLIWEEKENFCGFRGIDLADLNQCLVLFLSIYVQQS